MVECQWDSVVLSPYSPVLTGLELTFMCLTRSNSSLFSTPGFVVSPLGVGGSFSPPPLSRQCLAAGGVITEGLERRRRGQGQRLLQLPVAEVRCRLLRPPARVSASLKAGSEASPPPPPAPRPAGARAAAAPIAARGGSQSIKMFLKDK